MNTIHKKTTFEEDIVNLLPVSEKYTQGLQNDFDRKSAQASFLIRKSIQTSQEKIFLRIYRRNLFGVSITACNLPIAL